MPLILYKYLCLHFKNQYCTGLFVSHYSERRKTQLNDTILKLHLKTDLSYGEFVKFYLIKVCKTHSFTRQMHQMKSVFLIKLISSNALFVKNLTNSIVAIVTLPYFFSYIFILANLILGVVQPNCRILIENPLPSKAGQKNDESIAPITNLLGNIE